MKKDQKQTHLKNYRLILFVLFIQLSTGSFAQIFIPIPIFMDYEPKYHCKPQSEKAENYYLKSLEFTNRSVYSAIELLKGSIKEDSLFCDAYYKIINSYLSVEDYNNALIYTDLALKFNSLDIGLISAKGKMIYQLGEYEKSLNYFNGLIEKQPRKALWYYYAAESLIKLNQLDSAKKVTMEMETILYHSNYPDLKVMSHYLQGKIAYLKEEYATAQRAFDSCKKMYRKRAEFCYYYGMTYFNRGEIYKARKYLTKAANKGFELSGQEIKLIE